MIGKYKIITLCGSTKFKDDFLKVLDFAALILQFCFLCGIILKMIEEKN